MGSEVLALFCGLAAAASFGTSDFCGGFATKRNRVFYVLILSQCVAFAVLAGFALTLKEPIPSWHNLLFGGLAGFFGTVGLVALYIGLARGSMGVVASVSAVVGAVLPIISGIFMEGPPSAAQIVGLLMGLCAIWYLAGGGAAAPIHIRELGLPILAGIGFGFFFIFIDQVSETSIFWPLAMAKGVAITMILAVVFVRREMAPVQWKPQLLIIIMAGVLEAGGNIFFALASRMGRLDISTTLTSLYPAGTVFLAWMILRERLVPRQWFGVTAALVALILIAS